LLECFHAANNEFQVQDQRTGLCETL
jgi:hypothetical protein